jgi:hypothetical protein
MCRILAPEILSASFKIEKGRKIEEKFGEIEFKDVDVTGTYPLAL